VLRQVFAPVCAASHELACARRRREAGALNASLPIARVVH
jgi:hypothetical protein